MSADISTSVWLQYTHLEKLYGYLPGMLAVLPDVFGLTAEEYTAARASFDLAARQAAEDLLTVTDTARLVDALPFRPGQRVLAVGDSITDDLQSWAEILRHLCELRHGSEALTVTNAGLSAHTSAMVLRRWPASLAANPDWVICALGGNDVTRVGPDAAKTQVSPHETVANLREMRRIAAALSDCRWVWMTPVPVNEDRVGAHRPFQFGRSSWHNADITALAKAIKAFDDPVVDLVDVFGVPARDHLQGPDGVHPSLDGQKAIVRALLQQLGTDGGSRSKQQNPRHIHEPGLEARPAWPCQAKQAKPNRPSKENQWCLSQCSTCRCRSTGTSPIPTTSSVARMASGCTSGPTRTGSPASRPGRPGNSRANGTRVVLSSRVGGPLSSWITGAGIMAVARSSYRATGRQAARWGYPLVTYVTDGIESAMAQAKAAAGDRDVQVRGAYSGQRALEAGVLDEVQIHQIPVLLGRGRRLFDVLPSEIELEIVRVIDTPEATHIRYRVRR